MRHVHRVAFVPARFLYFSLQVVQFKFECQFDFFAGSWLSNMPNLERDQKKKKKRKLSRKNHGGKISTAADRLSHDILVTKKNTFTFRKKEGSNGKNIIFQQSLMNKSRKKKITFNRSYSEIWGSRRTMNYTRQTVIFKVKRKHRKKKKQESFIN